MPLEETKDLLASVAEVIKLLQPPVLAIPAVSGFNPNSFDSQFASLHSTLAAQDKSRNSRMDLQDTELSEIKVQTQKINGRVTSLEGKWKWAAGWVVGAAAIITLAVQVIIHFWR